MSHDLCVLGLGYIGLPTAAVFATRGKKVLGVDVISSVVETINRGEIHIKEPDLDVLVRAAVQSGNLIAALKPEAAETFVVAVPTPFKDPELTPGVPAKEVTEPVDRTILRMALFP